MSRFIALFSLTALSSLTAFLFTAGCSSDDPVKDNPVLGCDRSNQHQCVDYGTAYSQEEANADCDGSVLQGPCTTNNTVGSCQIQEGFVFTHYYYATGWSVMTATADCADRGGSFSE